MGLTIHYSLKSDADSPMRARQLIEKLRQAALDLPMAEVGEVREFLPASRIGVRPKLYTLQCKVYSFGLTPLPPLHCKVYSFGLTPLPALPAGLPGEATRPVAVPEPRAVGVAFQTVVNRQSHHRGPSMSVVKQSLK